MTSISIFDPSLLPTEAHTCTCTTITARRPLCRQENTRAKYTRRTRDTRVFRVHVCLSLVAVIAVAPTGEAFFVYSYVQTMQLMGQYNGK